MWPTYRRCSFFCFSELEVSRTAADAQAAKQAQLEKQLETALLDVKRLQDLDSGTSWFGGRGRSAPNRPIKAYFDALIQGAYTLRTAGVFPPCFAADSYAIMMRFFRRSQVETLR